MGGLAGRQKHQQRGHVVRRAQAQTVAQRCGQRLAAFHGFGERHQRRDGCHHLGHGHGHDGVDSDVRPRAFRGPGACHGSDAGLGRRVVALAKLAALARDGTQQHHTAAVALRPHLPHGSPCAGEAATQVGLGDQVELIVRHVPQHPVAQDTCVGTQDVQAAKTLHGACHQAVGCLGGANGHHFGHRTPAFGCDQFNRLRGCTGIHVVDDHTCTCARQRPCKGQSQASAAAGHDGRLV